MKKDKGVNEKALKHCIIHKLESSTHDSLNEGLNEESKLSSNATTIIKKNWRAMAKEARMYLKQKKKV